MSSPTEDITTSHNNHLSPMPIVKQRKGPKKGYKFELAGLLPGGSGGRPRRCTQGEDPKWSLGGEGMSSGSSSDEDSSYWASDSDEEEEDDEDLGLHDECLCLSDMSGNRILPIQNLCDGMSKNLCCQMCAEKNHKSFIHDFLYYARAY